MKQFFSVSFFRAGRGSRRYIGKRNLSRVPCIGEVVSFAPDNELVGGWFLVHEVTTTLTGVQDEFIVYLDPALPERRSPRR